MGGLQYAGYIVPFLLLINLTEFLLSRHKKVEVYRLSDTIVNMCCGMLERLFDILFVVFLYFLFDFFYTSVALWHIPSNPWTWVLALLAGDFLAYWFHRMSHEINLFWAAHIVHHQSEELNITTVFRVSAFAVLNRSLFWIWLPIVGFSPEVSTSVIVFIGLFQFLTHSRLVGNLGVLEYIFVTPSHHRVHHGRNDKYIDKNYGHVFIIWDKMLGTFEPEQEEPEYGIISGFKSSNPYWAYFSYWSTLFKRARSAKHWKNKLKVFLMPPAWENEDVPHLFHDKGEAINKKYKLDLPLGLGVYTFINVLFTMGIFTYLLFQAENQDIFANLQLAIIIIISIIPFGPLLERKRWALKADIARLVFLAINIPFVFWRFDYSWAFISALYIYTLVMLVWLLSMRNYFIKKGIKRLDKFA